MMVYYFNIFQKTSDKIGKAAQKAVADSLPVIKEAPDGLIVKISDAIRNLEDLASSNKFFENIVKDNKDFIKIDNNVYKYNDYFINIGKKFKLNPHAHRLEEIREYKLSSAPEIIAYSDFKNNMDCVLITRIKNSKTSVPVPYEEVQADVTLEAKNKFLQDFDKLARDNIAVDNMLNKRNWYVVPETGDIILSNWSDFSKFGDEVSKSIFKNKLRELCGLIY